VTDSKKLPVWHDKYDKMGVTPLEIYMRQEGLCWLKPTVSPGGLTTIVCTDGKDEARTDLMLNPTFECMKCICNFTTAAMNREIGKDKSS